MRVPSKYTLYYYLHVLSCTIHKKLNLKMLEPIRMMARAIAMASGAIYIG